MKKDRDCGCNGGIAPYPIYPTYVPNMQMPIMAPNVMAQPNYGMTNGNINYQNTNNTIEQQLYSLNNQINSLERRVNNLETLIGNNGSQYNTSNYQVM